MKKRFFTLFITLSAITMPMLHAQVTIGSGDAPTYGALLELKTQQAGSVANVGDDANITSTAGGLLLPRVKLTTFTSLNPVVIGGDALSNEQKLKLAGLMVYNINAVASTLYLGVYVWNGSAWAYLVDSKVSSPMTVSSQPKAFSFYETGEGTATALSFSVNPPKAADGSIGTVTYQWYQLVGSNTHARIGAKIGETGAGTIYANETLATAAGSKTKDFTPTAVLKGTTRNASNTGFYRFYCVATGSDGSTLKSDIVEVAVGCGAKNNLGEWISFMCFNLGATNTSTIASQIAYPIAPALNTSGQQTNVQASDANLYGDLFQWGRIRDGHEKRLSATKAYNATDLALTTNMGSGFYCYRNAALSYTEYLYPTNQIRPTATDWYGKFITTNVAPYTWTPIAQTDSDLLWRLGRFVPNDPCAKYKADGTFVEPWTTKQVDPTLTTSTDPACTNSGTSWRTPTQADWGDIYRGGQLSGSPAVATANTWAWNSTNGRGYQIRPDGTTTTLFLPASSYRNYWNGLLYYQGNYGYYWSTTPVGTNAYNLHFTSGTVYPANSNYRGLGFALRCIKN